MSIDFKKFSSAELTALISAASAEMEQRKLKEVPDGAIILQVEDGCIDQRSLHYDSHKRGKNWIATVTSDKKQPGGLSRTFWANASGSYKVLPDSLTPGDRIEVADDYTSSSGKANRSRHFYVVHSINAEKITLVEED